jgi:hypothetical protein
MLGIFLGKALFPYSSAGPELLARIGEFLGAGQRDPGLASSRTAAVVRAFPHRA